MKNIFLILFFGFLISYNGFCADNTNGFNLGSKINVVDFLKAASTIDEFDTVVFDLSQAIVSGNYVSIPVSILSDDTINALDFSFKYDHTKLLFDSIIDLTNYIQTLSYFNGADSTVRFTSNSFQQYTNDTSLVLVRFVLLTGSMVGSDLNSVLAYLNGQSCSVKVVNSLINGDHHDIISDKGIKVYPIPAKENLYIELSERCSIKLTDIKGQEILELSEVEKGQLHKISIQNISDGIYFLNIYNDKSHFTKKVMIRN